MRLVLIRMDMYRLRTYMHSVPGMFDNSLNFEPTFIDTGVLYSGWNVKPSNAVEDRKSDADTHLAMLGVKRGNRHFGHYLEMKAAGMLLFVMYKMNQAGGYLLDLRR